MKTEARYEVLTWDPEKDDWTPQEGVPSGPYTQFGLRKALRELRRHGYPCRRREDFAVLVQRTESAR